jgi:hypothetical protein
MKGEQDFIPLVEGPRMRNRLSIVVILALPLCTMLPGCGGGGGNTAHLQGTVTVGGQPIPADASATVTFDPTQTGPDKKSVSVPIVNGKYDSPETPTGSVKAVFTIQVPDGAPFTTDRGTQGQNYKNIVPQDKQAGVSLEVSGDNDSQNFDL